MMTLSPEGQKLIERLEGRKNLAYLDGGGVWTIGVGHTRGVKKGMTATNAQIDKWFAEDSLEAVLGVNHAVRVPLTQNQFDALVSLAFNIGVEAFSKSTLVRKLNDGDSPGAAAQFVRWNQDNGKVVAGLTTRRLAEAVHFSGLV
jgi:lysozyme